jgi:predicted MPP superfamily phosphohydrolase
MELLVINPTADTLKVEDNNTKSLIEQNNALKLQIVDLSNKISELEERLKKYTNGSNHKRYYEKNKEKIKESGSNYLQKLKLENPDKLKEYSKRAYENKKKKRLDAANTSNINAEERIDDRSLSPVPIIV